MLAYLNQLGLKKLLKDKKKSTNLKQFLPPKKQKNKK